MIKKQEFAALLADFIESQEFVEIAHSNHRSVDFVCHHNAYLVAAFLQRRGYKNLHLVSGYYQCREPASRIHHSWIKLTRGGKTLAILEFDPRQLHEKGGYENDLMPSAIAPGIPIPITGTASIVDPDLVELPEEAIESKWVISSREILLRYVEDFGLLPNIDCADLDKIGVEAMEHFELIRQSIDDIESE